jgi:lipopolysaccharide exporter
VGPLGRRSARGVGFMVAQTVAVKAITLVGQLILARLLLPADFGLLGMALTVMAFVSLIQNAGLADILIQRQAKFSRWANAAFWMSLTLGILASLIMMLAAPLAASFYHAPELRGLIYLLALCPPLLGLGTVPRAQLINQLRFRAIAAAGLIEAVGTVGLSIALAYLGFGAYSFIVPRPVVAAALAIVLWLLARTPLRWTPQIRRWKFLAGHAATLIGVGIAWMVVLQGDNAMLGKYHPPSVVGIYFFAYNLSVQTLVLLTVNVAGVLFPALSQLNSEPQRQMSALLRSSAAIAVVAGPLCLLQALLAPLFIPLLFGAKWIPAVPIFQVLTIAMTICIGSYSSRNMLKAQGRFQTLLLLSIAYATIFIVAVWFAASHWGAMAVAIAVSACFAIFEPLHVLIAIRPTGGGWRELWSGFGAPLTATGLAAGAGFAILATVRPMGNPGWLHFALAGAVGLGVYAIAARWLAPAATREILGRLKRRSGALAA